MTKDEIRESKRSIIELYALHTFYRETLWRHFTKDNYSDALGKELFLRYTNLFSETVEVLRGLDITPYEKFLELWQYKDENDFVEGHYSLEDIICNLTLPVSRYGSRESLDEFTTTLVDRHEEIINNVKKIKERNENL